VPPVAETMPTKRLILQVDMLAGLGNHSAGPAGASARSANASAGPVNSNLLVKDPPQRLLMQARLGC
jgi:hypothetical protein